MDKYEQIKKLWELKEKWILNQKEFTIEKKKILSNINNIAWKIWIDKSIKSINNDYDFKKIKNNHEVMKEKESNILGYSMNRLTYNLLLVLWVWTLMANWIDKPDNSLIFYAIIIFIIIAYYRFKDLWWTGFSLLSLLFLVSPLIRLSTEKGIR